MISRLLLEGVKWCCENLFHHQCHLWSHIYPLFSVLAIETQLNIRFPAYRNLAERRLLLYRITMKEEYCFMDFPTELTNNTYFLDYSDCLPTLSIINSQLCIIQNQAEEVLRWSWRINGRSEIGGKETENEFLLLLLPCFVLYVPGGVQDSILYGSWSGIDVYAH